MRKIVSKYAKGKKNRTKQLAIGIGLVLIMFFSVLGYSFRGRGENTKEVNIHGYSFVEENDFWVSDIGNLRFIFKYNPLQIKSMEFTSSVSELKNLDNYYNKPLYIFSENEEAELEIYRNLDQIVLRRQYACLEEEGCDENWPLKTCANNFIIIKEDNITEISQEENCVFIQGPQENLTKITDEFLFKILEIR